MKPTALFWFRQDLRLHDNTALNAAIAAGFDILPIFILDDDSAGEWKRGAASRWWLHESLLALNASLDGKLSVFKGRADDILNQLIKTHDIKAVFWNRCYEPWRIARDKAIKETLKSIGIPAHTFKDSLLWEPWEALKEDGTPYRVFTPFYSKGCHGRSAPLPPASLPHIPESVQAGTSLSIDALELLPKIEWYHGMKAQWQPGENGARKKFEDFLKTGLNRYKEGRDRPDLTNVSALSPHLHFGEISIRQVWQRTRQVAASEGLEKDADKFCAELGWREFSYNLLYHFPTLPREPLQARFQHFPWEDNQAYLKAWQQGRTGIPIVDAGMRQLYQTGWMHNRVRMIVASVLVKNMLIHWHEGENWFWDCLVDADLANNAASWQWVSGCGADAAPYFRIFNPVTQGEKFDPHQAYIKKWVPEFGTSNYPPPIIDLKETRERALSAFEKIKAAA